MCDKLGVVARLHDDSTWKMEEARSRIPGHAGLQTPESKGGRGTENEHCPKCEAFSIFLYPFRTWRNGSAVQNAHCSCGVSKIGSQHPHGASQFPVTPVPRHQKPSDLIGHHTHMYSTCQDFLGIYRVIGRIWGMTNVPLQSSLFD